MPSKWFIQSNTNIFNSAPIFGAELFCMYNS